MKKIAQHLPVFCQVSAQQTDDRALSVNLGGAASPPPSREAPGGTLRSAGASAAAAPSRLRIWAARPSRCSVPARGSDLGRPNKVTKLGRRGGAGEVTGGGHHL